MDTESFGDKSRLIIKNIPNSLNNKTLDKLIAKKCKDLGVTKSDVRLLTKEKKINNEVKRVSRGICYVGFISEKDATKFLNHYNNSYFNSCKVSIDYSRSPITNEVGETKPKQGPKIIENKTNEAQIVTQHVVPTKAGVSSKRVHITFDSDNEGDISDTLEDEQDDITYDLTNHDHVDKNQKDDELLDMNRVVIFNLPYNVNEESIRKLVKSYGKVEQIHIPLNKQNISEVTKSDTPITKGLCFVTFTFESDAMKFVEEKNKSIFSGRIITVSLAKTQRPYGDYDYNEASKYHNKRRNETSFTKFKMNKRLKESENTNIWNILHIDIAAAINTLASEFEIDRDEILKNQEAGVNAAISESYMLNEIKKWMVKQGVKYEVEDYNNEEFHDDIILIKNLPHNADDRELINLFGSFGKIIRFTISPFKLLGLVQYHNKFECDKALRSLSYKMYKNLPLYLQKVTKALLPEANLVNDDQSLIDSCDKESEKREDSVEDKVEEKDEAEDRVGHVSVYVSNIGPNVGDDEFDKHFSNLKGYVISKLIKPIPRKSENGEDSNDLGRTRYGFVEFDSIANAKEAIKMRCGIMIGGKVINLELSKNNQTISKHVKNKDKGPSEENDVIIVKNLPFQATKKELTDLFKYYSNVKTVRIPKSAGNTHRGFGFVVFMSKNDAKVAMENLKNVHLYGRRLVLQYVENSK